MDLRRRWRPFVWTDTLAGLLHVACVGAVMSEKQTTPIYKKVGRKYVPVHAHWYEDGEYMPVGTFRLTYAYTDGGRRYEYNVTPATAPTVAALVVAKVAIEDAITKASKTRPMVDKHYTKKQLACIAKFREDMGGMCPDWWTQASAHEMAEAAINAVKDFRL